MHQSSLLPLICLKLAKISIVFALFKAVFHQAEFSARTDIFSSKISTLNLDLISASILLKAKMVRKRRNKISGVEKHLALKKLLVLIALLRRRIQRQKQK